MAAAAGPSSLCPLSPTTTPQPPPPTPYLQLGPSLPTMRLDNSSSHTVTETRRLQVQTHARTGRRMINQYIILQELGRGVHGQVRLALDKDSLRDDDENDPHGRLVAVKIVPRQPRKRLKIGGLGPSSSSKAVPRLDNLDEGSTGEAGGTTRGGDTAARSSNLRFDAAPKPRSSDPDSPGDRPAVHSAKSRGPFSTTDAKIKREIAILKKLHHANVVSLLEVIDDPDSKKIFMVLEYMAGGELHWRDETEPLPGSLEYRLNMPTPRPTLTITQIQSIMRDLICGLQYLHYQGIIHRDIKPANLLWDEHKKTVKISDFGVSHFSANLQRIAQQGSSAGNSASASAASSPPLTASPLFPDSTGARMDWDRSGPPTGGSSDSNGQNFASMQSSGILSAVSDEQELAKTAGSPAFFAPELCVAGDLSGPSKSFLSLRHLSLAPSLGGGPTALLPDASVKTNPHVMSPGRRPPITKAIDIWAVGVTLYCLCFGQPPFDAESEFALFSIIPNEDYEIPAWAGAPDREQALALGVLPSAGEHLGRRLREASLVPDQGRKRSSSSGALLGGGAGSGSSVSTLLGGKGKERQSTLARQESASATTIASAQSGASGTAPKAPTLVRSNSSSFGNADEEAREACGRLRVGPRARRWGRRRVEEVASGWGSPWASRRWADQEADVHPESRRPSFSAASQSSDDAHQSLAKLRSAPSQAQTLALAGSSSAGPTSPIRGPGISSGSRGAISSFARPNPPHWSASPSNDGSWLPDFPTHLLSSEATLLLHLLDGLLTKDPTKRMTLDEVKIHPFLLGGFPVSPEAEKRGEEDVAREQALAAREWLERTDVESKFEQVQVSGEDVEHALTVGGIKGEEEDGAPASVPSSAHPSYAAGTWHGQEAFKSHDANTPGASDVWLALAPLAGVAGVSAHDALGGGRGSETVKLKAGKSGGGNWKTKLKEKLKKWGIRTPAPSRPGTRHATPLATPAVTRLNSPVLIRSEPGSRLAATAATAVVTTANVAATAVTGAAATATAATSAVASLQQAFVVPSESGRFDDADEEADPDPDPGADAVSLGGFPRSEPLHGSNTGMPAPVDSPPHHDIMTASPRVDAQDPWYEDQKVTDEPEDDIDINLDELSDDDIDEPALTRRSLARSPEARVQATDRVMRNDGTGWKYDQGAAFGRPAEATLALARDAHHGGRDGSVSGEDGARGADALRHFVKSSHQELRSPGSSQRIETHGLSHETSRTSTLYSNGHVPASRHASQRFQRDNSGSAFSSISSPGSRSGSEKHLQHSAMRMVGDPRWGGGGGRGEHDGGPGSDGDDLGDSAHEDDNDDEDGCVSFEARKVVKPKASLATQPSVSLSTHSVAEGGCAPVL
ncbi:hypothetical protein V8E36_008462 [Tilletia maclaganii]